MHSRYHRSITLAALDDLFSPAAREEIIAANLRQDRLRGQVGHPEFHFDSDQIERGLAYLEECRREVVAALRRGDPAAARAAFGRLTHACQDLYAHSNYVTLWLERFPAGEWPPPETIDPLDANILNSGLRSGKVYLPLEPLSWINWLRPLVLPLLPRDSHAWMNLDVPERGPKFAYACAAATRRTGHELEQILALLTPSMKAAFLDSGAERETPTEV